jgi:hypothetical protein
VEDEATMTLKEIVARYTAKVATRERWMHEHREYLDSLFGGMLTYRIPHRVPGQRGDRFEHYVLLDTLQREVGSGDDE